MKPIVKTLKLEGFEYYLTHLSIVNCLLPVKLTPRETEILAKFMSLDIPPQDRLKTAGKRIVRKDLELTHQGIANYMKSLQEKGFLIRKDGSLAILPILEPAVEGQSYMLKLENLDSW